MNGLIKSAKLPVERSNANSRLQSQQFPASAASDTAGVPVQLDRLAEEVVESVLAGYGYMHMADTTSGTLDSGLPDQRSNWHLAKGDGSPEDHAPGQQHSADPEAVQLFLDIEPAESWSFLMHPGAFRRIIMNLFGNSLKFTKTGFIRVHLRQESSSDGSDKQAPGFGRIILTVSDSGKGISEEYLRNQLYTPFAQEDHFAPGTGLGLSLVRQVVTALGGEIHVTSQVGYGTAVTASLPLPVGGEWTDEEQVSFGAVIKELAGLRVVLRGNGQASTTEEAQLSLGDGDQDPQAKSQLQLVESLCQGWLKMHIVPEAESQASPPDFIISTDESFSDLDAGDSSDPAACPHVFVCRSSRVVQSITTHRRMPDFFEVISQPLGPRKLAKSLYDSRRRWKEAQHALPKSASAASLADQKPLLVSTPSQAAELTSVLKVAGIMAESTGLTPSTVPAHSGKATTKPRIELKDDGVASERLTAVAVVPPPAVAISPAITRRSVLIVDDNPINRKVCPFFFSWTHHDAELTVTRSWRHT